MNKIKQQKKIHKLSGLVTSEGKCCVPDTSIFFNFQYITSDSNYNFEYIKNQGGSAKGISKNLLSFLQRVSQSSWEELRTKGKDNGGFETMELSNFKRSIVNNIKQKSLTNDTKLYVFRFGGNKYRLIGHKSSSCKAAIHILGFDFDHSLYEHGS